MRSSVPFRLWLWAFLPALLVLATPASGAPSIRLNEFLAANGASSADDDGDASDWIEVHNFGATNVNLAGWFLTDNAAAPTAWRFPAIALAPGQYRIVWASGKNRTNAAAPLHTNFQLDRGGGYLGLSDAFTNRVSEFVDYPSQFTDVSYGWSIAANAAGYFAVPTPGAANGAQLYGRVAAPRFSHSRGFYDTNFALALTSDTPGASIYYTTNGRPPSPTNGVLYAIPLLVTNSRVLRAAAFVPGQLPSEVRTHTYLFTRDVVRQRDGVPPPGWPSGWGGNVVDYGMDPNVVNDPRYAETIEQDLRAMPSLCLVMDLRDLFDPASGIYANAWNDGPAWERPTSLELIPGDGRDGFQAGAGLRIRGGFSRAANDPKHSFRFFFREEYGAGRLQYPLFGPTGAAGFDKFDLRCAQDGSWAFLGDANGTFLPDTFSRDTLGALGQPYTRGNFYHLYINGVYWGVYNTEERPEASFAASYFGGVPEDYDVVRIEWGAFDVTTADGDLAAWRRLWQAATNGFAADASYERVQGNNPDGTPNPAYEVLVDMDNLIDFMLLTIYIGNFDGPVYQDSFPNNYFATRSRVTRDGFRFFVHDAELSLSDVNFDRTTPITVGDPAAGSAFSESNPQYVWQRLWANAEFRLRTADHVQRHFFNGGALTPEACLARYMARTNELSRAMVGESARWGDAQREPPIVRENWIDAVSSVITGYFPRRSSVVLQQLRNRGLFPGLAAPQFSHPGGAVPAAYPVAMTHTNAAGTIWYTLDGTDPRRRGGAISPSALAYAGPVVVTGPTLLRARVKDGATWSALTSASYYPPQDFSGLQVTEIMYNPAGEGPIDGDEFEFLELKNAGSTAVDLTGLSFSSGINFAFSNHTVVEPGAFFVLARNAGQFSARYPGVVAHGTYSGHLDNGGENLRLVTALSNTVLSVTYSDQLPWPLAPDGFGFSLVPSGGFRLEPDDPRHWRSSAHSGGSPGADDSRSTVPPIAINEVLSRPVPPGLDAVELANPTQFPVDLAGWFLTDDAANPKKFRFGPDTVIGPGGYLVVDESQFNAGFGLNPGFSFGLRGDQVYLFSGDAATNLTGYSHGFSFGGAAEGVTFGRYFNSEGEEQFVAQERPTLGLENAGPAVGPVVINEIHYHPAPGQDEFVELLNISGGPVALFDPSHPTNTWRLNGAGFAFPPGLTVARDGLVVITSLAPASFRAKYGVPESVVIVGPLGGQLQDSGERLELQRPELPDTNGIVWISVDAVRYNDRRPWPVEADGDGPSLQRLFSALYADDPANWFASGATPGETNAFNHAPTVAILSPADGRQFFAPTNLLLVAGASDSDGSIVRVEFFDGGASLGAATGPSPYALVWNDAPLGTHTIVARAIDNRLGVADSAPITLTIREPALTNVALVPVGSIWRYYDRGQLPATNWALPAYNDSAWASGRAELGYGDGDEATVVSYGPNTSGKYATTYFRRTFANPAAGRPFGLKMRIVRDDGVVVWLNGAEIFRDNLPAGPIGYGTLALSTIGPPLESEFVEVELSPSLLSSGTNVLAVEMHQGTLDSSDLSFDLELAATVARPEPRLEAAVAGSGLALRWATLAGPYRLEQCLDLRPPLAWRPVTNAIDLDGAWSRVVFTNGPTGQRFFRLVTP